MPALFSPTGERYRTEVPAEVTRLLAAGYTESPNRPPTVDDTLFHPGDHAAVDVIGYLAANPGDAERVIAEEKAGKARITIIGSQDS